MESLRFTVKANGEVIAEHMELEYAVMLLETIFQRYFAEASHGMEVTVTSEPINEKVSE